MNKSAVSIFLAIILCGTSLFTIVGCSDYFKAPENHCIVGLNKDYRLYSETEGVFCAPIDKKIKESEIKMTAEYNYYSVIKGAEYTICIDHFINNSSGWGLGIKDNFIPAYWQGDVITKFEIEYDYNSETRHETFFTADYKNMNCNIAVSFDKNCSVKSVKEPYLNVGGNYETAEKGGNPLNSKIDEYLNTDGSFNEKDGFYYLLLENEVTPYQDAWKTNLDITDYKLEYIDDTRANAVSAQFACKPLTVSENQELWLHIVCRTYSGKYFVQSVIYEGTTGFILPIREHQLKLDFDFNKT